MAALAVRPARCAGRLDLYRRHVDNGDRGTVDEQVEAPAPCVAVA